MSEAIKLFGKTIPLPDCDSDGDGEEALSSERQSNSKQPTSKEARDRNETAVTDDSSKTPTADTESPEPKTPKTDDKQSDTIYPQDKPLKKPDKILPCPRCNSMDTKFCYYNNYNVSQPRHFCKNCQRYWTAGGTMRNVPVGAGRRKNKNPASQFRHITTSDAPHPSVRPNGTLLTFGSVLKNQNCASKALENCKNENNLIQNSRNYCPSQLPFFAVPPWVPSPGIIPMPFYPAPPYWGCYPMQPPWVNLALNTSPSSSTLGKHCREEHSIRQSEEEEEEEERERKVSERSLWVPKTLRIDDPGEAAKSSIWATLGINREKCDFADGGGRKGSLFKAFHSKGDEKSDSSNTSPLLQANPAALSRSRNFHESS